MPYSWLGNVTQLFTALGLGSLARQAASNVAITGGSISGAVITAATQATSDSSTSRSAEAMVATRAASRSLSPKRISAVATLSFSFSTGTAFIASSRAMVARALR